MGERPCPGDHTSADGAELLPPATGSDLPALIAYLHHVHARRPATELSSWSVEREQWGVGYRLTIDITVQ